MIMSMSVAAFATELPEGGSSRTNVAEYSFDEIKALGQYITVKNGYFSFNSSEAFANGIDQILIEAVATRIYSLNKQKENAIITISNNGVVTPRYMQIVPAFWHAYDCHGGINKPAIEYWWGYSRTMCDCESRKFAADLNTAAAIAGGSALLGAWFPPFATGGILSASYLLLLSSRVTANNRGRGVIADVTWALVFNITPQ